MVFLPWTGIQEAYMEAAEGNQSEGIILMYKALGVIFFCAMIPVLFLFLASFKTAVPVSFSALLIVIALILQGAAYLHYPMVNLTKAAGALFIIVGISLVRSVHAAVRIDPYIFTQWYSALSVLLQEEGIKIVSVQMPTSVFSSNRALQLPVLPLPRM